MSEKNIAIVGGAGPGSGGGGTSVAADTLSAESIYELVDAISEGEIEGFATADPLESIYFDGVPVRSNGVDNYDGVSVDYRTGTQSQTHFEGEADYDNPGASLELVVDRPVKFEAPVVRTITNPDVDAAFVSVVFSAGLYVVTSKGDTTTATVEFTIDVKSSESGVFQPVDLLGRGLIEKEKTSSKYKRVVKVDLRQFGTAPFDIRVNRVTEDPDNSGKTKHINEFSWATVIEVVYAKLRHPNTAMALTKFAAKTVPNIPRRGFLVKGMKIRVPNASVYDPIARTYTGAFWDGTFVVSWSRNPAWILYDLLTDPRYGLGNEIDENSIDKWGLFQIAKRCDELVPDGFGGTEQRYSLDLYLQKGEDAKKAIQDIAATFDCMVYWGNGTVLITQDAPKDAKAIFTNANVVDGKFEYTGSARQTRFTACSVQWNDPSDQFNIAIEYVEDPDGIARLGFRDSKVTAIGCSSRAQAHRYGKRILLTTRLETDIVGFTVGLEGMVVAPGDVIGVRDYVRTDMNRLGGRVVAGSTTSIVNLDAPVTIGAGETHYLSVISKEGVISTSVITNGAGDHATINLSTALASAPANLDVWAVHTGSNESKLYRVIGIEERDGKDASTYVVSAVQYDPSKYDLIDSPLSLMPSKDKLTSVLDVEPPTNLTVLESTPVSESGVYKNLDVSWTPSVSRFARTYRFAYTFGEDKPIFIDLGEGEHSVSLQDVKPGPYHFEVRVTTSIGALSQSAVLDYTVTSLFAIADVAVTNVAVRGIGSEFFGKSAEFSWETDADVVLDLPTIYSNGNGGSSKWFRDFEVKIYDVDGVTLLRTEYVTEFAYEYTYEKNVEDGGGTPRREFAIEVRARSEEDGMSTEGTLSVINHPPSSLVSIETLPSEGGILLRFPPIVDYDYKLTRVFASKTMGFVPDDTPVTGNLVWEGTDRYINVPISSGNEGQWYVVAQGVDEFGASGANYSDEIPYLVKAVTGFDPVTADNILASIVDFNESNNRNGNPILIDPVIVADGTAIDHTLNDDGSIDVSFEWTWAGDESTIDGFAIYGHSDKDIAPYDFLGQDPSETVWQVPSYTRTYIWRGVAADNFYTVGVVAFRKVDADVAYNGLIHSTLVQPTYVDEDPYYPPAINPASGDILTTIDGIPAEFVNDWGYIDGVGRPFDNADVTADQTAGSGINIVNSQYAIVDDVVIPPYLAVNGAAPSIDTVATYFGKPAMIVTASGANAQLFLGATTTDYNFAITPNKKWILSVYVMSSTANASGQVHVRTDDAGAYKSLSFLTSPTPNTPTRVSGEIDLTTDPSSLGLIRVDVDSGAGTYIMFQAFMMEEMIGNLVAPSAFVRPAPIGIGGIPISEVLNSVQDFDASNNRNATGVLNPVVASDQTALDFTENTDGSVNISFQWSWSGDEGDIDGFEILYYVTQTNHGVYEFGTDPTKEMTLQIPANARSYVANAIAGDNYITVAIVAYRAVDKDISANGVIVSSTIYANGANERPFRPTSTINFSGNVDGQVGGQDAGVLVTDVATAYAAFEDIIDDNVMDPGEKNRVKGAWDAVFNEYSGLIASAASHSVSSTALTNAYNALYTYLQPLLGLNPTNTAYDGSASSVIVGSDFRAKLVAYYDERQAVSNAINGVLLSIAGGAQTVASAAQATANGVYAAVDDIVDDNKMDPGEKSSVKGAWDVIFAEKPTHVACASKYGVSSTSYVAAYDALYTYLQPILGLNAANTAFTNAGTTTAISGAVFRANATAYYDERFNLLDAIADETASRANWSGIASRPTDTQLLNSNTTPADIGYTGDLNANYITNTNQLSDGAGLGNTANWDNVSSKPTTLSGYSTNLGNITAGSITGSAGINITGIAVFNGSNYSSTTGSYSALLANGGSARNGIQGVSTGSYSGVLGKSTGSSGHGVSGTATGFGYGVLAQNPSGTALHVNGRMSITNTTLVNNLNAHYVGGFSGSSYARTMVSQSGTAIATNSGLGIQVAGSLAAAYRTTASGSWVSITDVSDQRLKKDIVDESLGLDFVNQLTPRKFKMKQGDANIVHHGFIAQEMQALIGDPNIDSLYTEATDGVKGVGYLTLISPLTKAIQELSAKVNLLTNEIEVLKNAQE